MSDRLDHVGLVVADLERSLSFYRDRIGLELIDRGAESDARYAEMLGVSRVRFAWAELALGGGLVLELLRFDELSDGASQALAPAAATVAKVTAAASGAPEAAPGVGPKAAPDVAPTVAPKAAPSLTPEAAPPLPATVSPGVAHLGVRVDDIDAVHAALVSDGATVFSRPIELDEENRWLGLRVFYALDPDGHLVELIQGAPAAGPSAAGQ